MRETEKLKLTKLLIASATNIRRKPFSLGALLFILMCTSQGMIIYDDLYHVCTGYKNLQLNEHIKNILYFFNINVYVSVFVCDVHTWHFVTCDILKCVWCPPNRPGTRGTWGLYNTHSDLIFRWCIIYVHIKYIDPPHRTLQTGEHCEWETLNIELTPR